MSAAGSAAEALAVLDSAARRAGEVMAAWTGGGAPGEREGQYALDLAVDPVVVEAMVDAGWGVLSEESGLTHADRAVLAVVDPVDGSTNAARGIPWYAASLCLVDEDGPWVALVRNLATGSAWSAVRGEGAFRDGRPITTSGQTLLSRSVLALAGSPSSWWGWAQVRNFGAAALHLCAVADGTVDAYADSTHHGNAAWDYLAGMLIVTEAGGRVVDAQGRDMVVRTAQDRRVPIAAATSELCDEVLDRRRSDPGANGEPGDHT